VVSGSKKPYGKLTAADEAAAEGDGDGEVEVDAVELECM
jgi:hypothetical protein